MCARMCVYVLQFIKIIKEDYVPSVRYIGDQNLVKQNVLGTCVHTLCIIMCVRTCVYVLKLEKKYHSRELRTQCTPCGQPKFSKKCIRRTREHAHTCAAYVHARHTCICTRKHTHTHVCVCVCLISNS